MGPDVIHAQGFGVAFGERVILAELDFSVPAQGVTVLMGPTGTGKSSLLRALAGLSQASARYRQWGELSFQGQPVGQGRPPALVVQNARALGARVLDHLSERVRASLPGDWTAQALREHLGAELERLGCADLAEHWFSQGVALSAGQQRRLAVLAEALTGPWLLMLDEPTAGLPEPEVQRMLDLLRRLARRMPLLLVLHNQQQAKELGQHLLLLAGGRIQAAAPIPAFFERPPNAVAAQFVRTGSCNVASPDAAPGTLDEAVPPPPPLPAPAVAARAAAPVNPPAQVPRPAPVAAPAPIPVLAPVLAPDLVPASPELVQTGVKAGPPSLQWPSLASTIAPTADAVPEYRGPRGFRWVVPGRLGTAPLPGAVLAIEHDLASLRTVGVTTLITLTRQDLPQDKLAAHGLRNLHLPIYDREAPSIPQLRMLVVRMTRLMKDGEVLAVHCRAGLGRTGTVVAGWLIHEGLTADAALERLRRIDKEYVQTQLQEDFLRQLETSFLMKI